MICCRFLQVGLLADSRSCTPKPGSVLPEALPGFSAHPRVRQKALRIQQEEKARPSGRRKRQVSMQEYTKLEFCFQARRTVSPTSAEPSVSFLFTTRSCHFACIYRKVDVFEVAISYWKF